ncbi:MAG: alpha/beta fold hydrolase, partial [Proteobacteria bacterium]|nr:alpha/beta fold hydrolase [Pseudomonadota bacterium]
MTRELELVATDGVRLAATLFEPRATSARAVAIQSAVGVPQRFYAKFAAYLSMRGFTTMTYDYRGIGRSRKRPLRGDPAHLLDWAERDIPAAWDALEAAAPGARLFAVGHSFGGQAMGLLPRPERVGAMFAVGSQSGYWKHWSGLARLAMWGFTHVAIPATATVFGYAAASRIGMGEDL